MALISDLAEATGRSIDLVDLQTAGEPLLGQILSHGQRILGSDLRYAGLVRKHLFDKAGFLPYRERILRERRQAWIGKWSKKNSNLSGDASTEFPKSVRKIWMRSSEMWMLRTFSFLTFPWRCKSASTLEHISANAMRLTYVKRFQPVDLKYLTREKPPIAP